MSKYNRLLFILNLVRSRKSLNAASIAKECNVTERSVYRDVVALSEAGIPIYYDRGYKLATDCFLPPLNFDFDEYVALKMILESSPLKKSSQHREVLKRIMAKVESTLSDSVKEKKKQHYPATHVSIATTYRPELLQKFLPLIESAINSNHCLDMLYDSLESGEKERQVEPYFVIFKNHAFYFVAWCTSRKAFRTFRIDRIKKLAISEDRFLRQKGIDAVSFFDGRWSLVDGEPTEVVVRLTGTAAKVVKSGQHFPNEIIEPNGSSIIYRVQVRGTGEIGRWILGFGHEAEVLTPADLRDSMRSTGEALARLHQRVQPARVKGRRWTPAELKDS